MILKHIINSERRDYFIKEVNEPLLKNILSLVGEYPEPTHENVLHPNTQRLIEIRDKFFECWTIGGMRKVLIERMFRVVIDKYEHSPNWRNFLDWFLMMVKDNWKPFNTNRQMPLWRGK